MDTHSLAALVLRKYKEAGGYSDVGDKALLQSIQQFLQNKYEQLFFLAQMKIKQEEIRGIFPDTKKYESEYQEVEDAVMAYANILAATDKAEL
jgi:hypothetical protein